MRSRSHTFNSLEDMLANQLGLRHLPLIFYSLDRDLNSAKSPIDDDLIMLGKFFDTQYLQSKIPQENNIV